METALHFLEKTFSPNKKTVDEEDVAVGKDGLLSRLSEATKQADKKTSNKVAVASVLSASETERILNRLPAITAEAADEADFALRERSLPPPRTGQTIEQQFPPPLAIAGPEAKNVGPLEVLRFSPEGDVPIAPNLSVTFSQPMVAVSSQEEAAHNVPIQITPEPKGHWRWIGTKTLLFEPDVRFPMATKYSVSVSAGTRSANGGSLTQLKTWSFTTPAPTVKRKYPTGNGTERRDTLIFAEFDQRIDPAAALKTIKVIASQLQLSVRLASPEQIEADKRLTVLVKNAEKDRWIVFRAVAANGETKWVLPAETDVTVSIGPGTPSAEGP